MSRLQKRTHWVVRVTHWVNVVALPLMVASGLRIFDAYPAFARKGETFCCYPFEGTPIPAGLTFGGWLAGARHWHFAVMWLLVVNALVYVGFLWLHGEWRDLAPRRGDLRDAWEMVRFYLFLRPDHPRQGKHNALQKNAYVAMPVVTAVIVLSGIAIWKPVELHGLTMLFGGYMWARYVHFVAMVVLVLLVLGHVFMVFAVDPYALRAMVTGWYDPARSPEARNARPFYHLFARGERAREPAPVGGGMVTGSAPDDANVFIGGGPPQPTSHARPTEPTGPARPAVQGGPAPTPELPPPADHRGTTTEV